MMLVFSALGDGSCWREQVYRDGHDGTTSPVEGHLRSDLES